jgi:hypothetical protein
LPLPSCFQGVAVLVSTGPAFLAINRQIQTDRNQGRQSPLPKTRTKEQIMSEDAHETEVFATGEQLKAAGIEKVQRRAWHDRAFAFLEAYIRSWGQDEVMGSDLIRHQVEYYMGMSANPPHPNSWGALLSAAAKAKLIERVGFETSRSLKAHGRIVSVWRKASVTFPTSQGKPDRV